MRSGNETRVGEPRNEGTNSLCILGLFFYFVDCMVIRPKSLFGLPTFLLPVIVTVLK